MTIPELSLSDGSRVPALGEGTWHIGNDPDARPKEIAALRAGIDAGMTRIDTAEMYGDGASESVVGEAIAPGREQVDPVAKVLPHDAPPSGTTSACEESLEVLGTDWVDLYLLHWPGPHPIEETIEAFESLKDRGLIGAWGVSNFDPYDLAALPAAPVVNQVLYNPSRRGIEFDLLPMQRAYTPPIPAMAYSPIEQGRLLDHALLRSIAEHHGASVAQVLLAWAIRSGDVIAIPKSADPARAVENAASASIALTAEDLAAIDAVFPAPTTAMPLEVL